MCSFIIHKHPNQVVAKWPGILIADRPPDYCECVSVGYKGLFNM